MPEMFMIIINIQKHAMIDENLTNLYRKSGKS